MKLKKMRLQGFTSYIDSEIEFKDNTISTIVAPNGYGKSSILEAITTALFYKARGVDNKGTGMEDLINNNCKEFIITLDFQMNNVNYRIIRKKSKVKHELNLFIDGVSQSEKITETQAKINNIIKMDYETFLDTVCIGQGKSGNFMSKPANERKEVFANILGLSQYETYEKKAKEKRKDLVNQLNEIRAKIEMIKSKCIEEDDIKNKLKQCQSQDLSQDIKQAKQEYEREKERKIQYETLKNQQIKLLNRKQNIINNIQNLHNQLATLKQQYIDKTNKYNAYNDKLKELQGLNIVIPEVTLDIAFLNSQKNMVQENKSQLEHQMAKLQVTMNFNRDEINKLKTQYMQLKQYNEGVCEFCGNIITATHKDNHLKDLFARAKELSNNNKQYNIDIEKCQNTISDYEQEILHIQNDIQEYNNQVALKQKQELAKQRQESDIALCEEKMKNLDSSINDIKQQKIDIGVQIQELQTELVDYQNIQPIEHQSFNDIELEANYNDLLQQQKNIETQIVVYQNQLNNINLYKQDINTFKQQAADISLKIMDYESVIEAFSKKGIQADMIANVLPDIENEINNVLQVLFNNSVNIEFSTQKENGKGNTLETLEIIIHDKGTDRKYETYSGGEKFRIDFAFHIGLSKFLSKRANNNIEFFMIDEGLGSQDDEGKDNFIMIVNQIKSMFKQIFIITHIEEIKDVFDDKIIITKDPIKGSIII